MDWSCVDSVMSVIKQFPEITAPYCIALEKSVGAIVYRVLGDTREYLVMQYPHGHWEFPRGHIESGESEKDTMYREIHEETGINGEDLEVVDNFRSCFAFSYSARGDEKADRIASKRCLFIRKKVVFYLALSSQHDVELSHEHDEFVWLSYDEAMEKLTFENARKVLTKAETHLSR